MQATHATRVQKCTQHHALIALQREASRHADVLQELQIVWQVAALLDLRQYAPDVIFLNLLAERSIVLEDVNEQIHDTVILAKLRKVQVNVLDQNSLVAAVSAGRRERDCGGTSKYLKQKLLRKEYTVCINRCFCDSVSIAVAKQDNRRTSPLAGMSFAWLIIWMTME